MALHACMTHPRPFCPALVVLISCPSHPRYISDITIDQGSVTAVTVSAEVEGAAADTTVKFEVIDATVRQLRHCFGPSHAWLPALHHPTRAMHFALLGAHAGWVLIGAFVIRWCGQFGVPLQGKTVATATAKPSDKVRQLRHCFGPSLALVPQLCTALHTLHSLWDMFYLVSRLLAQCLSNTTATLSYICLKSTSLLQSTFYDTDNASMDADWGLRSESDVASGIRAVGLHCGPRRAAVVHHQPVPLRPQGLDQLRLGHLVLRAPHLRARRRYGNFDIILDHFGPFWTISQLRLTPHVSCATLYLVPMLTGCLIGAWNPMVWANLGSHFFRPQGQAAAAERQVYVRGRVPRPVVLPRRAVHRAQRRRAGLRHPGRPDVRDEHDPAPPEGLSHPPPLHHRRITAASHAICFVLQEILTALSNVDLKRF